MSFVRLGEFASRLWPMTEHAAIISVLTPVATLPPGDIAAALGRMAYSGEPLTGSGLSIALRATPMKAPAAPTGKDGGAPVDPLLRFLNRLPMFPPDDGALTDDEFLRAASAYPSAVQPGWAADVERLITSGRLRRTGRGIDIVPYRGGDANLDPMIADARKRFGLVATQREEPAETPAPPGESEGW